MNTLALSRKKTHLFTLLFLLALGIIIARLALLQIYYKDHLEQLSKRNFIRSEQRIAPRGSLYDCNNKLLATNRPIFDLYWVGSGKRYLTENQTDLLNHINKITGTTIYDVNNHSALRRAEKYGRRYCLARDVDYQTLCALSEQCPSHDNLLIESRCQRHYPHGTTACHILGYLGRNEDQGGQYGLEKLLEDELAGESGMVTMIKNSTGKRLELTQEKSVIPGRDAHITIDIQLQKIAQTLFAPGQTGAFIVLDPYSGAIKTMASFPHFDPNIFLRPISHEQWRTLNVDNPFINRAVRGAYPPASLFKLITFAAGLEKGIITQETQFMCEGHTFLGTQKYHCQRRWGHGMIDSKTSLAFSCNIPCYEIAKQLSIEDLADYAARFGLGMKTDILLSELSGCVPTSKWKQAHFGQPWWKGETLSSGIGQSYLLATPLQAARMIASIYTGFLVKPRLLSNSPIEQEDLAVSPYTRQFLQDAMRMVVQRGTARILKKLDGFTIYAKTGTAQTISLVNAGEEKKHREHAWFASYFHYAHHRPLVMVILVEHAGSSRPALTMARSFFQQYAQLYATH